MAGKRRATVPAVRDTLPAGATIVFDAETCAAFVRAFRRALAERGYGTEAAPVRRGGRRGRKNVD